MLFDFDVWNVILKATTIHIDTVSSPELLNEVLPLLDDVDGGLQGGLLLLAKTLDQVLNRFHRLGIHIIQQFLLKLLQPSPELTVANIRKKKGNLLLKTHLCITSCTFLPLTFAFHVRQSLIPMHFHPLCVQLQRHQHTLPIKRTNPHCQFANYLQNCT